MTVALVLGAVFAVAVVLFVAGPFLRQPTAVDDVLEEVDPARLALVEERDRALAALKELEFDHRTGKLSDADYRALVGPVRRQAADALRTLDAGASATVNAVEPEPPAIPEPGPVPHEPPQQPEIPEPYPPPSTPPEPVPVPEPGPVPHELPQP